MGTAVILDHTGTPVQSVQKASIPLINPSFFWADTGAGSLSVADIQKQPYAFHWLVYACVRTITRNIARLPKQLTDSEMGESISKHPVLDRLNNPNPYQTRTEFFEAIANAVLLPSSAAGAGTGKQSTGGQCIIVCDNADGTPTDLTTGAIPYMMWPFDESRFEKNVDKGGKFAGWKVTKADGTKEVLKASNVIRIKGFNPYDWFRGLSPLTAGQIAFSNDLASDVWNSKNFDNDAVPAGILSTDEVLTDATAREVSTRWYEKYGGAGNQRRVAVMGQGLKFQQLSYNAKDMEFSKQKDSTRKTMLALYGLNEIAIGNYESVNYATIVEGRRMLWNDTYLPLDEMVNTAITHQWVQYVDNGQAKITARDIARERSRRKYGRALPPAMGRPESAYGNWTLTSDLSGVEALRGDMTAQSQNAQRLSQMGAPFSLACEMSGITLPSGTLDEYPFLAEKPVAPNPFGAPVAEEPTTPDDTEPDEGLGKTKSVITLTRDVMVRISDAYIEKVLTPGESYFVKHFGSLITTQRNEMQDKVDEWVKRIMHGKAVGDSIPGGIDPKLFTLSVDANTDALARLYKSFALDQLKRERRKLIEELGAGKVKWNVTDPMAQHYVDKRKRDLKEITKLTFKKVEDRITASISEAIEKNETVQQLAKRIKADIGYVEEVRKNQSKTIARTETGIVSSDMRQTAFVYAGVEYQQWLNAADEKVRDAHKDGENGDGGRVVKVGERFPHTHLLHPLDVTGELGQIINCRCVCIAVANEDGGAT